MLNIKELQNRFPNTGKVEWIGVRTQRNLPVNTPEYVFANQDGGLENDHYSGKSGKRHVTLIQAEHLLAVASLLKRGSLDPGLVRRNIVIEGINLLALKNVKFKLGEAVLEGTGLCHPCSKMEKLLGPGGYNAMRGHGGITAKIISSGKIKLGDLLVPLADNL